MIRIIRWKIGEYTDKDDMWRRVKAYYHMRDWYDRLMGYFPVV